MTSIRQHKVAKQVQRDISEIIQQNSQNWFPGTMVSVTIVRIAPDLSFVKVYLSVFGAAEPKELLTLINNNVSLIRGELGKRVKNQLRIVPEIAFYLDDSIDYAEEIENLLKD